MDMNWSTEKKKHKVGWYVVWFGDHILPNWTPSSPRLALCFNSANRMPGLPPPHHCPTLSWSRPLHTCHWSPERQKTPLLPSKPGLLPLYHVPGAWLRGGGLLRSSRHGRLMHSGSRPFFKAGVPLSAEQWAHALRQQAWLSCKAVQQWWQCMPGTRSPPLPWMQKMNNEQILFSGWFVVVHEPPFFRLVPIFNCDYAWHIERKLIQKSC